MKRLIADVAHNVQRQTYIGLQIDQMDRRTIDKHNCIHIIHEKHTYRTV
jgi:hypothetical protein